jgi:hypothetical protein
VRLEPTRHGLSLHRPVTHLAKLYIEPTNACNVDCATCFRHGWDEPVGRMSDATFEVILGGLVTLGELPTVYFGGIGEPVSQQRPAGYAGTAGGDAVRPRQKRLRRTRKIAWVIRRLCVAAA